jgi:hypothetical protein
MSLWNPSARDTGRPSGYRSNVGNPALSACKSFQRTFAWKIMTPAAFRISARGRESRSVLYQRGNHLRACVGWGGNGRHCGGVSHSDTREYLKLETSRHDFRIYALLRVRFEYYDGQISCCPKNDALGNKLRVEVRPVIH